MWANRRPSPLDAPVMKAVRFSSEFVVMTISSGPSFTGVQGDFNNIRSHASEC
jgi:hypothetical protein